jgi:hypothetical protein
MRRKRGHYRAVAALGAAGLASAAAAQPSMPSVGPTGGPERRVDFSLRAAAVYDSAVPRRNVGPAATDRRREDVLYSPSAGVDVVLPLGRFYTFAQGDVGYEFYQSDPKLNSDRIDVVAGAGGKVGPCGGSVSGSWARGRTRSEDLTLGFTDNVQESQSISGQLQCAPVAGLTFGGGAAYAESNNTAARGVVDSESVSLNGFIGYQNRALGSVSLIAQYQDTDNMRSGLVPIVQSPGIEVSNVGLQYERPIGRRLLGRIGLGYGTVKSPGLPDNDSLTADVALTYTPSSRLTARLSYRRYASSTIIEGVDYVLNEQFRGDLTYNLTSRISLRAGADWLERSNRGQIDPNLVGAPSNEEVVRATAGVSAKIGQRSTISLDAQYQDRRADVPALSFDSVRVGLVASTSF